MSMWTAIVLIVIAAIATGAAMANDVATRAPERRVFSRIFMKLLLQKLSYETPAPMIHSMSLTPRFK